MLVSLSSALHKGYDHGYYFIQVLFDHLQFHAIQLESHKLKLGV